MPTPGEELRGRYRAFSDNELLSRVVSGTLTETALEVATAELADRKVDIPKSSDAHDKTPLAWADTFCPVRFQTIARSFNLTWLQILRARLEADGIGAFIIDENVSRMNPIFSAAWGGIRLQVPEIHVKEAREILADVRAGRLALPKDSEEFGQGESIAHAATLRIAARQVFLMGLLVAYASYRLFSVLAHVRAYWAILPLGPGVVALVLRPVFYLMASLLLAVRARLAILVFAGYLVCTAIACAVGYPLRPLDWFELALTGTMLYFCLHLLGRGRLK